MSLKDTLSEVLASIDGGLALFVMAYDGISIEEAVSANIDFDVQLLAVEYAAMLNEIKKTVQLLNAGAMEDVAITTEQVRVLMHALNEDLFIMLVMQRDGNFGKGRYLLNAKSIMIRRELS